MDKAATVEEKLETALRSARAQLDLEALKPRVGLVLGSGLGELADAMTEVQFLPYQKIEGFPQSTVAGHKGRFVLGRLGEVPVLAMQGRVHYYEGYPMSDVVLPTRLMGKLGIEALLLTNAAGGMGDGFQAGDFMLITDHIVQFVPSPLIGPNASSLGTRFPDMSKVYDPEFCDALREAARETGVPLQEGVYCQLTGPQFETPAEIQMLKKLGASAVGMSTAVEAVAARHMGLRVCGISCISNLAAGVSDQALSHEEVNETTARVGANFRKLVLCGVRELAEALD